MLQRTPDKQAWLDAYRQALQAQHAGVVARMLIYGSKARGDDYPDSDLDVLLVVRNDAAHLKRCLRRIGEELAATSEAVSSLLPYTEDEWESRKKARCPFSARRRARRRTGAMNRDIVLAEWLRASDTRAAGLLARENYRYAMPHADGGQHCLCTTWNGKPVAVRRMVGRHLGSTGKSGRNGHAISGGLVDRWQRLRRQRVLLCGETGQACLQHRLLTKFT
jgi:predicted nucleotidyltransferase